MADRNPGNLNLSRFTTTANRICRLYISTLNPSHTLVNFTKYILWVYAFSPSCVFGAVHLSFIIRQSRLLDSKFLQTIQNTISRNSFYLHPENFMLAILNDDDENIRYRGWTKILEIKNAPESENIRVFDLPSINFNANNYIEMIDFDNETKTIPPVLKNLDLSMNDANAKKKYVNMTLGLI